MQRMPRVAAARRRAKRLGCWAAAMLLGGCVALGSPDLTTSRVYPGVTSDELYDRTLAALRASGLEVIEAERADGEITAAGRFEERSWAECERPRRIVRDSEARSSVVPAAVGHREVELTASVGGGADGASLTLAPTFSAEPESPMATTGACTTTRVLERQILEQVAEGA